MESLVSLQVAVHVSKSVRHFLILQDDSELVLQCHGLCVASPRSTWGRMDSLANAQQRRSSLPSPPPELWNFVVIVIICGLVGWMLRLAQHFLTLVDVRFAVNADAVLHMKDLGPSLFVLENASMWHFQQLLRTKLEVVSAKMASVRLPFEIQQSSLTVTRTPSFASKPGVTAAAEPTMHLSLKIKSMTKCVAQVLWGVKTDALLGNCCSSFRMASARAHAVSSPIPNTSSSGSRLSSPIPVLRSLSAQKKNLRQRAADLPTFLSRVRRQNRRHRLNDDDAKLSGGDDRDGESGSVGVHSSFQLVQMVGVESFRSASPPEKFNGRGGGAHEYVVEMPSVSTSGPAEEIRSLLAEVEHDAGNPSAGQDATPPGTPKEAVVEEPRYGAVVLVGSLDFFENDGSELNASDSLLSRSSKHFFPAYNSSSTSSDDVICQCAAIDFLLTPTKPEKFTPVVVKKLTFTRSNVYVQQDIFGRDANSASGECVICLEGELAAVLLPCRHFCVCRACHEEIDRCPICRAKFVTYTCYAEPEAGDGQQHHVELKIV